MAGVIRPPLRRGPPWTTGRLYRMRKVREFPAAELRAETAAATGFPGGAFRTDRKPHGVCCLGREGSSGMAGPPSRLSVDVGGARGLGFPGRPQGGAAFVE